MSSEQDFLGPEDQQQIVAAIKQAESKTSGEIKVHIEKYCPDGTPIERAKVVFEQLGMQNTALKNGVLFYLAYEDHKFAVIGDVGIYKKVPHDFWDSTKELLRHHFSHGEFKEGLCNGIREAGVQLKTYFPTHSDDINELPDDISFG
ncbi:TPM domain-containing protein [Telluribacter sp. SYSU D00476]|uniref:TPM domain-containing protein n=1 Tax=Telluribacter sp. SYSU D00476 TaxID=2811430 RepID=UPI001FF24C33|nr:TPM domain-containing protein [Telluribacter sp. SYSU D00476]